MGSATQSRLLEAPMAGLYPLPVDEANRLIVDRWQHKLGAVNRPFRQEAYALELRGATVAVATSGSIVNGPVAGYERNEVVELTRLAGERWATRIMLRLWREVCAPAWDCWPVLAAVSYSVNALHTGDLYRFDGWEKVREDAGATRPTAAWGKPGVSRGAADGYKTLWVWRYDSHRGELRGTRGTASHQGDVNPKEDPAALPAKTEGE
jgi:antitoxin VapB